MGTGDLMIKIAAATEDSQKITSHFGMAPYYQVISIENGQVVGREQRQKPFHAQHPHGDDHHHNGHHHEDMFDPIADCQVLLCGGMGQPAYQKALAAGLQVYLVGGEIGSAVEAYLCGELYSDLRRVHGHS
jgi:predicted Fe-Mo cluster-binding NifX family protein